MNREEIYKKWSSLNIKGKPMLGIPTIVKFNEINDYYFGLYVEYHNYFFRENSDKKISSYKTYRSKIVDFILKLSILNKRMYEITQDDIEDYFNIYIYENKNTFNSRVSYIKDFMIFHNDKYSAELKFDHLLNNQQEILEDEENAPVILSSEEIEAYREKYSNEPIKLFLFEIIYYSGISPDDLRLLKYNLFHKEVGAFILKNNIKVEVPKNLYSLIEKLKDDEFFNSNKNYTELINQIKRELRQSNILENFKPSDIKYTVKERAFFKCPECGKKLEGIVDNWCAKQYYKEGNYWIVCKECGEINE